MEGLFFLIVVGIILVNVFSRVKKSQEEAGRRFGQEGEVYSAPPDEIRKFLRSIGQLPPEERESPPSTTAFRGPAGLPPGAVVPSAPRAHAQRRKTPPPPPVEESVTRRLVRDGEHLDASIDAHVKQRRLDQSQQSLQPMVGGHLKELHVEEAPAAAPSPRVAKEARAAPGKTAVAPRRIQLPKFTAGGLKQAFVMSELLQPPIALRRTGTGPQL